MKYNRAFVIAGLAAVLILSFVLVRRVSGVYMTPERALRAFTADPENGLEGADIIHKEEVKAGEKRFTLYLLERNNCPVYVEIVKTLTGWKTDNSARVDCCFPCDNPPAVPFFARCLPVGRDEKDGTGKTVCFGKNVSPVSDIAVTAEHIQEDGTRDILFVLNHDSYLVSATWGYYFFRILPGECGENGFIQFTGKDTDGNVLWRR